MSMLIFDFSTGIRIAAPTAVLASMHPAPGRRGILIKSGGALEKLAGVNAMSFRQDRDLDLRRAQSNSGNSLQRTRSRQSGQTG